MAIQIPLSRGFVATVDDIDGWLNDLKWFALKAKTKFYACRTADGKAYMMHRVIMEDVLGRSLVKGEVIDHRDGNPFNNCRSNLRVATYSQNAQNRKRNTQNKSGFKGVYWHSSGNKWAASICKQSTQIHLGLFDTPEAAYAAYCEAAKKHYGEFANFGTTQS